MGFKDGIIWQTEIQIQWSHKREPAGEAEEWTG